jgi:spore germination protein
MTRHIFNALIIALLSLPIFHSNIALANSSNTTHKAWAYQAWWLPDSWKTTPLEKLDRLLFFEIKVNANGSISEKNGWPEKWLDLSAALKKANTPLDLTLTLLNTKDFQSVFSSEQATATLLEQAASLASDKSVAGLHLDFEVYTTLPEAVQTRFQGFVTNLAKKLRSTIPSKNLSIFLPIGASSPIYTKSTLAQVNQVVAQGYDAHWASGPNAGPIAPLDGTTAVTWKKAIASASSLGVSAEKLLLSYPFYGYEWKTSDKNIRGEALAEGITTTLAPTDAKGLPAVRVNVQDRLKETTSNNDLVSGSSFYQFQKDGQWTTGWYEGQWALNKKIQLMQHQKIAGMAFFVLGYDDGKLLNFFHTKNTKPLSTRSK